MMLPLAFLPEKRFMLRALELAKEAAKAGEVPVGAVVVKNGQILGEGRNRREENHIHQACQRLGTWRLTGCQLYVTLEPCPMCTGAIINAHVDCVVYGADDDRAGCCGTAVDLFSLPYSHRPELYRGFYEAEAKALLQEFFQRIRT